MKIYSQVTKRGEEAHRFTKGILMGFVVGGMVIALVTGMVQLSIGGAAVYMKAGWFHAKLLCAVLAIAASALVIKEARGFCSDEPVNASRLGKLHGFFSLLLLVMIVLARVRPF
jgi:uncharacterized membrane protein